MESRVVGALAVVSVVSPGADVGADVDSDVGLGKFRSRGRSKVGKGASMMKFDWSVFSGPA